MLYNIFCKLNYVLFKLFFKVKVNGLENIPKTGRAVICSNHIGNLDPVLIAAMIPRRLNYMGKKELFENKLFAFIIRNLGAFPVDRESGGLSAIKASIRLLKKEEVFAMFPEGTRTLKEDSENVKPGIAMISIKGKSPIIPIHIDSNYKIFKDIKINIGKPIYYDEYFDQKISTEKYKELSQYVLKEVYKLKPDKMN